MSVFFFKQKTAYEMRISDWSSDVCSSDLDGASHLSLLVQRNLAQRKHTPPSRPVLCTGFAEPAGFSERASCPRGKRRTSLCGALRVLSAASAASDGPRESTSPSTPTSTSTAAAAAAAAAKAGPRRGACSAARPGRLNPAHAPPAP